MQAGKRRLRVPGAGGVRCGRELLSEGRCAPSGPLWLRRSGPRKACGPQLCRHLPQGSSRCRASSQTRSPYAAVNAAIACVSARPAERPRQLAGLPAPALPGCQPWLKRVRGSAPNNPGRRSPSRVGVGGEVEGRHCGAVQGRRALRGCLASPGEVVGVGASRWPGVIARQDLATSVICQVGLPLCHERFAIGPSRDQEGLLGAAP